MFIEIRRPTEPGCTIDRRSAIQAFDTTVQDLYSAARQTFLKRFPVLISLEHRPAPSRHEMVDGPGYRNLKGRVMAER